MMTKPVQDAYIVAALRSPIGKAGRGQFAHLRPDDLLAQVIAATLAKAPNLDKGRIEDVLIGCAMPEAEQGMNVARIAALLGGVPDGVPAMTVNRFCSSGLQTVASAAMQIQAGQADLMLAGGVESMSSVPLGGNRLTMSPSVFANSDQVAIAYGMGLTAEIVAERWQISREAQDAFALQSHQRALAAQAAGHFNDEIAPINVIKRNADLASGTIVNGDALRNIDEGPRQGSSLEALAKLRSVFKAKGTVTAGNSSQVSDGAAALVVASEKLVKEFNLTPLARFRSFAVAGVPPEIMGVGPVKAVPLALERAGLTLDDIDWIELNEAFAAQSLAVINELHLDPAKVNPQGGAIALGHPLGATGAIRSASLIHGMRQQGKKYGMVTMCIGTGMGAAGIYEVL